MPGQIREKLLIKVDLSYRIPQDIEYSCVSEVERFEEEMVVVRSWGGVGGVDENSVITQETIELLSECLSPPDKTPVQFCLLQNKLLSQPEHEGGQGEV